MKSSLLPIALLLAAPCASAAAFAQEAPPPANAATFDTSKPVIGFGVAATPEGLLVEQVLPRSAADAAGLGKGDVVTHVNGISLAGMALETAIEVLGAAPVDLVLTVEGRGDVPLRKAPVPKAGD